MAMYYDWLQFMKPKNKQRQYYFEECNDIIRKMNLKSFEAIIKFSVGCRNI